MQARADTEGSTDILQKLRRYTGRLRMEIASAIHRRRVPDLVFWLELRKEKDR
jgi:ribosome-binding factor A